jgi:ABC-2 type transport system ATP-binding protein
MSEPVVKVEGLYKNYGAVEALRGVSFEVQEGELFGLLGPNGAGKTTTVEILEGLRMPDRGSVRVCRLDPQREPIEMRNIAGASLQSTSLPDKIRVAETLEMFARFYRNPRDTEELLKRFQLEEKRDAFYHHLSGGQKQRLALALALVNNPRIIFLDEPTAGLDPQVRREIYHTLEDLKKEKKTILLTTHYIEEAERLCDRVAIVDNGRVMALGTPRELKQRSAHTTRIELRLSQAPLDGVLGRLDGVAEWSKEDDIYALRSTSPTKTIVALVKYLEAEGVELQGLEMQSPSLEDVFLELTGRHLRE